MRLKARFWLAGVVAIAITGLSAPVALGAFGIEKFFAANCGVGHETCGEELVTVGPFTYSFPKEVTLAEAEAQGFTQAGGRVPFGVTHFKVTMAAPPPTGGPTGTVTHIRTDVAPGLSTNPTAVPQCSMEEFGAEKSPSEVAPGIFIPSSCAAPTIIGVNKVTVFAGGFDVPLEGTVYNLQQAHGQSSLFGVALNLGPVGHAGLFAHTLIEGHIEWGKEEKGTNAGDYHDYFEINVSPALPLISSRLVFNGRAGNIFVTNATSCPGNSTTTLSLTDSEGTTIRAPYTPPLSLSGCSLVPFAPGFSLTPETKQSDQPDGITTELSIPHASGAGELDSSQLKTATVTLPEGMTLNPAAAQGLEACTPAQARIHSSTPGVACPEKSELGTVALEVPDLPPGSLSGKLYLGGPESGPITGPPYTMYLDAESSRYGISTRLEGTVVPNEATGRVSATFAGNPEQPFSNAILKFKGGALAPIANPLVCGPAKTETSLVPYTGTPSQSPFSTFTVDSNNAGGVCPSPLPFSLTQGTEDHPTGGAQNANFTLNVSRPDGQQYLSKMSTTLPAGLLGRIPAVPLCPEPQATLGTCSSTSQIGIASTTVGSGATPAHFSGPVYLTGKYGGAPYGLTVVINATVGPFSLGNVVTRAGIEINPFTARVTVASQLPTIVKGIPLRLKTLSVAITRQGYLINPTNCATLATESTLTSTLGALQLVSTPFAATGCGSLAFKPKFGATTSARTSRQNGASLVVNVNRPTGAEANMKSVLVTVPKQLPSRLSTLKKACLKATFEANPYSCPSSSRVGGARIKTPLLPGQLSGPAYFVSHGGAAFPDLDLVMTGSGVTIILVGNTNISKGITTTKFATLPDAPFTGFEMNLPVGPNSAVTGIGNLCAQSLVMPTTITAQNGKVIKQSTKISVTNCPVRIVSHRVSGHKAILSVQAPEAGRVSGGGSNLRTVYKHPGKAGKVTLEVPLSNGGVNALAAHKPLFVRVRVGFLPKSKGPSSTAFVTVVFP